MKRHQLSKRLTYTELGIFLKGAREKLLDEATKKALSVPDVAGMLRVSPNFVYQVEKGTRKPRDGDLGNWASVYGVNYVELCKRLHRIPMNMVASLKQEVKPPPDNPFLNLTERQKKELLPYLYFIRWKLLKERVR